MARHYTKYTKPLFFSVFAAIFLIHTVVLASWVRPCALEYGVKNVHQAAHAVASSQVVDDAPCHDMAAKVPTPASGNQSGMIHKHCKGLCLCSHILTTKMPVLAYAISDFEPVTSSVLHYTVEEQVTSLSPYPLLDPPRLLS